MVEVRTAKLFRNGASQAVRLPREFRFEGDRVRLRRVGKGVLLEPLEVDIDRWLGELRRFDEVPFMEGGRHQPRIPERTWFK
jgi:antitoxin VapB